MVCRQPWSNGFSSTVRRGPSLSLITMSLRIKLWDYAQVDSALFRESPTGDMVIAGVEIDAAGRIVAYHVFLNYFPGAPFLRGLESSRVPAENVVHFFKVSAAGQVSGLIVACARSSARNGI